jgi:hypothetical protein
MGMLGEIFLVDQEKGMYRSLDSEKIINTCQRLNSRIRERFPQSGLSKVAQALLDETQAAGSTALWLAAPLMSVRVGAGILIAFMVILFIAALFFMEGRAELFSSIADLVQGLDAAVNEIILFGAATFFLLSLENRLKRRRALKAIHTLRSMAHIIDMHQLTKDPDRLCGVGPDTPSSPERKMTRFELTRYLDYCSEMLAIISKIAALYVQDFRDPVTLSAVDEVQDLTTGLADKIWQKIVILHRSSAPF